MFVPVAVVKKCMVIIHQSIGRADRLERYEMVRSGELMAHSTSRIGQETTRNKEITIAEMGKKGEGRRRRVSERTCVGINMQRKNKLGDLRFTHYERVSCIH